MEIRISKMAYADKLLPYLGFTRHGINSENRFLQALGRVKEYEGEIQIDQEVVTDHRILSQLNDPIMNRLFISIIEIIEFFCKQRAKLEKEKLSTGGSFNLPKL